ncbi:MAG: hypothetical protein A2951_03035 [Candidatus Buchananbacteria bacterium RIFCSPLOWO2_01_FULL_56_15]|uniref:Prepilin-type N-terminal cleavage/methylation domain-containing protein n=1 Tax=Candidatus Buchananbacteria bacterium RIFCSPLOWO2_01_FULL_56_15 TaxID=1797547 RepID=A0A1G1YQP4_9BACT|nr:MAG: hypothetical protein A2951_03035 [Candidatus Buchananbacteria bacterium RIFCSPLOWO2_01_FULL_56_15]
MKCQAKGFTIVEITMALIFIILIVLVIVVDPLGIPQSEGCVELRHQIQTAKESAAVKEKLQPNDPVTVDQLKAAGLSLTLNAEGQVHCPDGGIISLNSVGTQPTCSRHH